jgi:hypothetical protein
MSFVEYSPTGCSGGLILGFAVSYSTSGTGFVARSSRAIEAVSVSFWRTLGVVPLD